MWVCSAGKDMDSTAVGHKMTEYFSRHGYHITTNTIRRLTETEADESYANRYKFVI
jgi:protein-tyrosine-phosphatase